MLQAIARHDSKWMKTNLQVLELLVVVFCDVCVCMCLCVCMFLCMCCVHYTFVYIVVNVYTDNTK